MPAKRQVLEPDSTVGKDCGYDTAHVAVPTTESSSEASAIYGRVDDLNPIALRG